MESLYERSVPVNIRLIYSISLIKQRLVKYIHAISKFAKSVLFWVAKKGDSPMSAVSRVGNGMLGYRLPPTK